MPSSSPGNLEPTISRNTKPLEKVACDTLKSRSGLSEGRERAFPVAKMVPVWESGGAAQ